MSDPCHPDNTEWYEAWQLLRHVVSVLNEAVRSGQLLKLPVFLSHNPWKLVRASIIMSMLVQRAARAA
jgi:hypothetical protein